MQDFLPLITGGAGALVVLALWVYSFFAGKVHSDDEFRRLEQERDYWRTSSEAKDKALEIERSTVNATAQAGAVTNQLLTALTTMAAERRQVPPPPPAGLTAKDLGL